KWDKIMKIKNHYKMRLEELFKKEKSLKVLANTGKMKAQRHLGEFYEKYFSYFDLDWRDKKIFYWFEKAARQGDIKSMIYITKNYFCSDQNESNLKKSLYFMRKGAELGSAEMQCVLGSIYLDIKHPLTSKIEPDRNLAIKWLGKSADQEYPYALFLIGHYLENDPSKKLKLFFRAAMKGEIQSMSQLIEMYFSGYKYGLPDDPVSAYIWNDIRKTFIVYPEDINEDYNFNLTSKQWIQANEVISFLKTEIKKKNYFASSCFQGDYSKRFEEAYPHPLL
ncbi:MAG: tetratricopeptide repeat protein, partial [bacterium]